MPQNKNKITIRFNYQSYEFYKCLFESQLLELKLHPKNNLFL